MCADTSVDDDPSSLRGLLLHDAKGVLCAEEGCGEVDVNNGLKVGKRDVFEGDAGKVTAGIVKDEVEAAYVGRERVSRSALEAMLTEGREKTHQSPT
jgi:hypothetical protein